MNIRHDGGSLVTFTDPWPSRNEPESDPPQAADSDRLDHYRVREFAERAAAKHARSAEARRIHQELAESYARLVRRAGGRP